MTAFFNNTAETERNKEMFKTWQKEGLTYRALGNRYGISHTRAQQIIKRLLEKTRKQIQKENSKIIKPII